MTEEVDLLIKVIETNNERTDKELAEMRSAITRMSENFERWYAHVAVYEEDKKHDAEFKKEVRHHMKKAEPLLAYVSEQKGITGKMKTAFFVALMFAVFALLGFNIK